MNTKSTEIPEKHESTTEVALKGTEMLLRQAPGLPWGLKRLYREALSLLLIVMMLIWKVLTLLLRVMFVCLFAVYCPTQEFLIHGDVILTDEGLQTMNYDLHSAFMAIKQWGFFSVPYLLWHGASFYNCHLRGSMPLKPIAQRLEVERSLPVFTT